MLRGVTFTILLLAPTTGCGHAASEPVVVPLAGAESGPADCRGTAAAGGCAQSCSASSECPEGHYCWALLEPTARCVSRPPEIDARPISVLEFNIHGQPEVRAAPAFIDTLVAADADVAVLIEADWEAVLDGEQTACGYYFAQANRALERSFKAPFTDYYCARGIPFPTLGAAIFSRFPILSARHVGEGHPAASYGDTVGDAGCDRATTDPFLHAELGLPGGRRGHVVSAHLKCCEGPESAQRRLTSQTCVNSYLDSLDTHDPALYLGDLNSFSPDDQGSCVDQEGLSDDPLRTLLGAQAQVGSQRWTDAFRAAIPLRCENPHTFGATYPSMNSRIDFILANGVLAETITDAALFDDAESDHRAVRVTFDLRRLP